MLKYGYRYGDEFAFASIVYGGKEFEKAAKKQWIWMFSFRLSFIIIPVYTINWHNLKGKRNVGNGTRLSCRRQRINDKLQHTTWWKRVMV
jgi:hypothetical protein